VYFVALEAVSTLPRTKELAAGEIEGLTEAAVEPVLVLLEEPGVDVE
jgi:hypothetical protein